MGSCLLSRFNYFSVASGKLKRHCKAGKLTTMGESLISQLFRELAGALGIGILRDRFEHHIKQTNEGFQMLQELLNKAIDDERAQGLAKDAKIAEQAVLIAELQTMLASRPDLKENEIIINAIEYMEKISQINSDLSVQNSTPVADVIVSEVVANPDIPTPEVVAAAPEVAPEVTQEPAVVEAALEAIIAAEESIE